MKLPKNLGVIGVGVVVFGGLGLIGKKWYDLKKVEAQVLPPTPAPAAITPATPAPAPVKA